jgi:3',5'-cyclic AMP phosphodiesterase CpdA
MKIVVTGDNHIFYAPFKATYQKTKKMLTNIKSQEPDVLINVGDMGELLLQNDLPGGKKAFKLMLTEMETLYVPGNHDLYASPRMKPDDALFLFVDKLEKLGYGRPLQTKWDDSETLITKNDCVFCGCMGWPDFKNPRLPYPPQYYEKISPTVDSRYIDLMSGWLPYCESHYSAFNQKIGKAIDTGKKNIIVATHYSIFDGQYSPSGDDISAYFCCQTMGDMIKKHAQDNPDVKFYCVSGHGHEYNFGKWKQEGENIFVFGLVTTYHQQDFLIFDTEQTLFS